MTSSDLTRFGFSIWCPFNCANEASLLPQVPAQPGAYAIRSASPYQRRIGTSDILYFGSATNEKGLKHRLRQYFHPGPTQRTNIRILALVGDSDAYEIAVSPTTSVPEAKYLEAKLLAAYEAEHGELPPENKRR